MRQVLGVSIFCLSALFLPAEGRAGPLTVSYFERPPYYFTAVSGTAEGFLVERTREILRSAQIEARFLSLTPNQIIYVLRYANVPHCSIGWFKNPERELFTKFTRPIYQNRQLVLLTTKSAQKRFSIDQKLRDIFSDPHLVMARIASFSYGDYVDRLMEKLTPATYFSSKNQIDLLKAIYTKRASYMLVAPEEIEQMIAAAGLPAAEFVTIALDEIPAGNFRYLMCGKAVSDEVMGRLNAVIEELYPDIH